MILADLSGPIPWIALGAATAALLVVDLYLFRPREVRDAALWTVVWTLLSFAAALPLWAFVSGHAALAYMTVYVVTRALSFDNLLVFIILFAYFGIERERRNELLALGIVGMLVLRALAILGGLELIHSLHAVVYVLGALLIVLAVRVWRGVEENIRPERNIAARVMSRLGANPFLVCLGAVVTADIAFAIDSIPAGFAITGNSFLIWMGNVFSLLGLPALFVLVRALIRSFRYLDETIALVLVFVGAKLILERWWNPGTGLTLGIVVALFAVGMAASLAAGDRWRDRPDAHSGG